MQGAGGVGGLLKEGSYYPTFDANGNVMQKLDGSGTTVMNVDYDPFGNVINGTLVGEYGFSTKPLIGDLDWYYYGFRYYDAETGRWPSRDPVGELGSVIMSYDFNFESTVKLWLYGEYATVLNIYHQFLNRTDLVSREMLNRYNEAFDTAYLYLEYFDLKMARAFSKGSFDDLNLNLFLGNDALNFIDLLGFRGTQGRARRAKQQRKERGRAPSGLPTSTPARASTAGDVAKTKAGPKTTRQPSALGGAISKVGGAVVGMGISTVDFMSDSQSYKDVTKFTAVSLRNMWLNGELSDEEFEDRMKELNEICK